MMKRTDYTIFFSALLMLLAINLSAQSDFIFGADLSYANMMEDCGAEFREDGEIKDIYRIFADNGTNLVRVRLWHNPDWQESLEQTEGVKPQYSNYEDVEETIFRAKMAGMNVMLGFQFSDFWSDPGRQIVPKAWEGVATNLEALKDSVYNYVYATLDKLNNDDLMPEYVKIGNENNSGIMTHTGMDPDFEGITPVSNSWDRHAQLYNAAIQAVRDISETAEIKPEISFHVANPAHADWFYSNLISKGVTDFDIIGFTYYYSYHGQSPDEVGEIVSNLSENYPDYDIMIVETGYLWDTQNIDGLGNIINESSPEYQPVSASTQQKFMVDLTGAVQDAGGVGVIFWEPDWVSTPCSTPWGTGSSQEHVAFFDHRDNLNFMKNGGGGWPAASINGGNDTIVTVTFKVDMTGADVSNGVFIVGQMTGWDFVQMAPGSNSIYSTSFELTPGEVFAYYHITSNSWDNYEAYRETVPEACANSDELLNDPTWTTDRAFTVPPHDTIIANVWASCETFNNVISFTIAEGISIYPNPPVEGIITIENRGNIAVKSINLVNLSGQSQQVIPHGQNNTCQTQIDVSKLKQGIYFIHIQTEEGVFTQRIILK